MNTPDMREQQWLSVILSPISVSGATVTVSDTFGLHPKAKITLIALSGATAEFEIKRVLNDTQILIGNIGTGITGPFLSPTLFNGGTLQMGEENRNKFGSELVLRAVYQEEPTLALRNMLVNKYGAAIDGSNPLPVAFDGTISIGHVRVTEYDNDPMPGDIHSSIRVGDGFHDLKINADGSINTNSEPIIANPIYSQGAGSIASAGNTSVFTYTSTNDKTAISLVEVTVSTSALVQLSFNGVVIKQRWTSPLERNAIFTFAVPRPLFNTWILEVKVQVERFQWPTYETFTSLEGFVGT